jgi:hypothetical protein
MAVAISSSLGWLDSNERERRAVIELVAALDEPAPEGEREPADGAVRPPPTA